MQQRTVRFIETHLTLDLVWWVLLPALLLVFQWRNIVQPNDFWWHVRVGQLTLEQGSIPRTDLFSFTHAGETWVNQAWLMQVWLYLQLRLGGLPLVIFLHGLAIAAGYACLQAALDRGGRPLGPALITFAAAAIGVRNMAVRPQTVSFLFMGLLVLLLERSGQGRRRALWLLPPLFALWANCHGAFIFGLAYLGLHLGGRALEAARARTWAAERRDLIALALATVASAAALALTPEGPAGLVTYVLGFVRAPQTVNMNQEFVPLSARQLDGAALFLGLLALTVGLARGKGRLRARHWLPLLVLTAGALWAVRVAPWAGFALAPALADLYLSPGSGAPRRAGKPALNLALLTVLAAALLYVLPWLRPVLHPFALDTWDAGKTPTAAVDHLCRTVPAGTRGYQDQGFASYLIYACPALPTFVDTRIELFPLEQWQDYLAVAAGRFDGEEILERYGVDYLLFSVKDQKDAIRAAEASAHWRETYRDEEAVVFLRAGD